MQAAKAEGKSTREIGLEHGVDHSTVVRRLAGAETNSSEMHHPEQELDLEPPSERRERLGWEWVDWTGPIRRLAELDADLEKLAGKLPSLRPKLLAEARTAQVAEALML